MSQTEPTFKSVFGTAWDDLPPVMKKHYANRPWSSDITSVEGTLDVMCKGPIRLLAPLMRLMGQIPARNEKSVRVTVDFQSDPTSAAFRYNRTFHFRDTAPYVFRSRMIQLEGNLVAEVMRFGLTWKMHYEWDGQKVLLRHRGYALHVFGRFIPLPLTFLMGNGYAEEIAIDDNTFDMVTHITHGLWGKIYEYKGRFTVTKEA